MRSGFEANDVIIGLGTSPRRFGARFLVLMLAVVIVCGSFGGAAYAATGAGAGTSAENQYGHESAVTPAKVKSSSAAQSQTRGQGGSLPFTGLSLAGTAVLGLALVGAGVALRRRERRS